MTNPPETPAKIGRREIRWIVVGLRDNVFSLFALRQGRACTKERIRYSGILFVPLAF